MKIKSDTVANRKIPRFIRHDHPAFVAFVEAYYRFMEENDYTRNLESLTDIDKTLDKFLEQFNNQLNHISNIDQYQFDKRLLLKNFKDMYLAKGSEASYRLLMRLLFQKEMEMFYPGEHLFSVDAANWKQQLAINITNVSSGDIFSLEGNNVTLSTPDGTQYIVFVDQVIEISPGEFEISITRGFIQNIPFGSTITFGDISAVVSPTTIRATIQSPGKNFKVGQIFEIRTGTGRGTFIKINGVTDDGGIRSIQIVKFGTGYNNNFFATLNAADPSTEQLSTSVTPVTDEFGDTEWSIETFDAIEGYVDFGLITTPNYWSNTWFPNRFYVAGTLLYYDGKIYETQNPGNTGAIGPNHSSGTELNGGVNLTYVSAGDPEDLEYGPYEYAGETLGEFYQDSRNQEEEIPENTALLTFFLGTVKSYPGYYTNSKGFLDDFSFLRDDFYWQEYSYVVKITEQLKYFKDQVLAMLHPGGMKLFGDYIIEQLVNFNADIEVLEFERQFSTIVLSDAFDGFTELLTFDATLELPDDTFPAMTEDQDIDTPFKTTWETTNTSTGSSNSDQITLPLHSSGSYNFVVKWGDGSQDTITAYNQAEITHTYAAAGEYDITIEGEITGWQFNNTGDKEKLLDISQWGTFKPGNSGSQFYGCSNLDVSAVDFLDVSGVTVFSRMFQNCSSLGSDSLSTFDVSNWDTSSAIQMNSTFEKCTSLTTLDVSGWDTSNVTNLADTFQNCSSLAALDVSNWNTSSFTILVRTFQNCSSLTVLDVSNWDVSNVINMNGAFSGCSSISVLDVSNWDTSSVSFMGSLFSGCSSISVLDVSNWDTSSVTNMSSMFQNTDITTIEVDLWNITSVTDMTNMFNGVTLDTAKYDQILVAWEAQAVQNNVNFHAGNSKFSTNDANNARNALINDHTWTITDGGLSNDLFDNFPTMSSEIGYSGYWDPFYTEDNNGQDPYVV